MELRDRRALKNSAGEALASAAYDPKKLVLIHAGISAAVFFLVNVIIILISYKIQSLDGLSGLATRSTLSTIQSSLQFAVTLVLPFWEAGYLYAALRISRNQTAGPDALTEGFRRFGPLLRCYFLRGLIYFGVGLCSFFVSMQIFILSPLSNPLYHTLESLDLNSSILDTTVALDAATQTAIMQGYIPLVILFAVIFFGAVLFISYNFRMCDFLILDHPGMGARMSMAASRMQMRGRKMDLFRIDLSFLWFYVLQVLCTMLAYGGDVLQIFGITLPMSGGVTLFLFYGLSLVCQLLLYYLARNKVSVTYAKVYDVTLLPARAQHPGPADN